MSNKHVVAVLLGSVEHAQRLAAAIESDSLEALVASGTESLHEILSNRLVDFVVVDNDLPGFLSGMELVERIYHDLLRPETILLARPTTAIENEARRIGIAHVLSPQTPPEQILSTIECMLARGACSSVPIPMAARKLALHDNMIQPMPQLLVKLLSRVQDNTVTVEQVADDIALDAKMTADLLKLVNSPSFGLQRKLTTIFDAVNYYGVRRSIAFIVSMNVRGAQLRLNDSLSVADRLWFNRRSVLIAATASTFAARYEPICPDTAYVLGMLQDLGILLMAREFRTKYVNLLRRFREIGHLRLDVAEQQEFGMTHAAVSAALLQRWKFPRRFVSLALWHNDNVSAEVRDVTDEKFLRVMRIGEAFANIVDGHVSQRYPVLARLVSGYGRGDQESCIVSLSKAIERAQELSRLFQIPLPDNSTFSRILESLEIATPVAK